MHVWMMGRRRSCSQSERVREDVTKAVAQAMVSGLREETRKEQRADLNARNLREPRKTVRAGRFSRVSAGSAG